MKICLTRVRNNGCVCNEYNLTICADECIGRELRRNLPRNICGDGIKINIIIINCDRILPAPALPCNDLLAISTPIRVIRKNPCCDNNFSNNLKGFSSDFNSFSSDFNNFDSNFTLENSDIEDFNDNDLNIDDLNIDDLSTTSYNNRSRNRDFNLGLEDINQNCFWKQSIEPQEYVIIVRSFSPWLSKFFCNFPQMFLKDCENTIKLTFIFDKNGSVSPFQNFNNCCGGCGGFGCSGFGSGGLGGCGCGCDSLFGLTALALLFCCC